MDVVLLALIAAALFVPVGVAKPVVDRLRLPFGVVLAAVGVTLGLAAGWFLRTPLTDALNPMAEAIVELPITADVFLYALLPALLFQATLEMPFRRMLDDWAPILVLAVVAVLLATLSVGGALHWASGLPLMGCLLVGSIVSTTDPSAVVTILRSISAPPRLARIVKGESLLDDAAAIALFGVFVGFAMRGVPNPDLGWRSCGAACARASSPRAPWRWTWRARFSARGRGEMFGQLAILARTRRRAEVRAITHGGLLGLGLGEAA